MPKILPLPAQPRLPQTNGNHAHGGKEPALRRVSHASRDSRVVFGPSPVDAVAAFLAKYIVLPATPASTLLVVATWVVAAWLADKWDRFPHLAITSPEKRCGKTTFLELLEKVVPRPRRTSSTTSAAIYRLIKKESPTLLYDEAQSLSRLGSEASEVMRELLNAAIDRNATVIRCSGDNHDVVEFPTYCPKVIALIGDLDAVLADRCLPVAMRRKNKGDKVERNLTRDVVASAVGVRECLESWTKENAEKVEEAYAKVAAFDIQNDRLADLLMPLQAVLSVSNPDKLPELEKYAKDVDEKDLEQGRLSPGVMLLTASREIFDTKKSRFLPTTDLLHALYDREEEPWKSFSKGEHMSAEALGRMLRQYGIKSSRQTNRGARGYYRADFEDAWTRYLHTPKQPGSPGSHGVPGGPVQ